MRVATANANSERLQRHQDRVLLSAQLNRGVAEPEVRERGELVKRQVEPEATTEVG